MKKSYKAIGICIFFTICLVSLILSFIFGGEGTLKKNDDYNIFVEDEDKKEVIKEEKFIVVEIKGEVKKPDVYKLEDGSIINDLIDKAGGITENADISNINRAEKLQNNKCIVINSKEDVETGDINSSIMVGSNQVHNKSDIININTATLAELDTLPGIGPVTAEKIIQYREENGGFKNIEELMNVDRIGSKSFEKLRDKIGV
ncbi:MAG: helix-hairpin-helix domain-containing protein [Clostridium sp.]